ncbi:MAG: helix-turn-helix transcriptional regulator [Defluviitaleaceae bacterium]|nr:helix-turn-helix transcriptional regulator [Defluviitaleaceae bacterium]
MDILEKIKRLQKEQGLNNAQLAKKAGLTPSTLQGLYKRNNLPTIPTLKSICFALGITIGQFFSDSNVPLDLTDEQVSLLEHWSTLNAEQKNALLSLIKTM